MDPKFGLTYYTDQQTLAAATLARILNVSGGAGPHMRLGSDPLNPTNAPPGSPSEGDWHVVGPVPTGDWVGQAGNLAGYYSGWLEHFVVPKDGFRAKYNGGWYEYDGTAWLPYYTGTMGTLSGTAGQGTTIIGTESVRFAPTAATNAITLPADTVGGIVIRVANRGTTSGDVYPASGGEINGLGVNGAYTMPVDTAGVFFSVASNQWGAVFT